MTTVTDLTKGSIAKTLIRFATPFLAANLLQTLYGIVDMMIVGWFADSAELAAVSMGGLVMGTFNSFIMGMTLSGTVLVGQFFGAGRTDDTRETVSTMFSVFPLIALAITVVLMLVSSPFLRMMNTPEEAFASSLSYVRICIGGMIFTAGYNTLAAALRGLGDSKNPLLFVFISCVVNILGDLLLVAVFKMGATGAAIATTASQALSMFIGIIYLRRRNFIFDFKPSSFRIHADKAKQLLRIGIPLGLQDLLVMASFIFVEAIINKMGFVATAAAGVSDRVFMVATIPAIAFSSALSAMVAQNFGAGKPERGRKALITGIGLSFSIGVLIFIWMALAPGSVAGMFTADGEVISAAKEYLISYKYEYLACSIAFCLNGFINGTGHAKFTLWVNIISTFAVRVPLVFLFSTIEGATLFHIGIALPIASAVQALTALIYVLSGKWRTKVIG